MNRLVTIVETAAFKADADKHLSEIQRQTLTASIAENPKCGVVLIGTGGCRKVRFALEGRGKSGSIRVIYSYFGDNLPTFLMALFAKNEKSNLSQKEKSLLAKVANKTKRNYENISGK